MSAIGPRCAVNVSCRDAKNGEKLLIMPNITNITPKAPTTTRRPCWCERRRAIAMSPISCFPPTCASTVRLPMLGQPGKQRDDVGGQQLGLLERREVAAL